MIFKRQFPDPADHPELPTEKFGEIHATATKQKSGWKVQSLKDAKVFAVHAALPVAIAEVKKMLGVGNLVVEFVENIS